MSTESFRYRYVWNVSAVIELIQKRQDKFNKKYSARDCVVLSHQQTLM